MRAGAVALTTLLPGIHVFTIWAAKAISSAPLVLQCPH
jgi:hypothetical protein